MTAPVSGDITVRFNFFFVARFDALGINLRTVEGIEISSRPAIE